MKNFFTFLGNARNLSGFSHSDAYGKNLTGLIPNSTTMKNFFTFLLVLAGLGLGANNLQIKNVALVDNTNSHQVHKF